jgi:hypothetical protein
LLTTVSIIKPLAQLGKAGHALPKTLDLASYRVRNGMYKLSIPYIRSDNETIPQHAFICPIPSGIALPLSMLLLV